MTLTQSHTIVDSAERRRLMSREDIPSFWTHSLEPPYQRESPHETRAHDPRPTKPVTRGKGAITAPTTAKKNSHSDRADAEMRSGVCFTACVGGQSWRSGVSSRCGVSRERRVPCYVKGSPFPSIVHGLNGLGFSEGALAWPPIPGARLSNRWGCYRGRTLAATHPLKRFHLAASTLLRTTRRLPRGE